MQPWAVSGKDAATADMLKLSNEHIALAFRIPLQILGIGGISYSSTELLMQSWIASGLGFALNHIEEAIGLLFALDGQPDEYVEFDTAALLRSAQKDRIEALARGVQGGIYAPNEAREQEGLDAVEFGDEPRVQRRSFLCPPQARSRLYRDRHPRRRHRHRSRSRPRKATAMTLNGKQDLSLIAPPESAAADSLLDAWREALAEVLDLERRDWQRERALIEAQAAAVVSTLKAEVAALRGDLSDMIAARLAALKDGENGIDGERGARRDRPAGKDGRDGIDGKDGDAGLPGDPGKDGERGDDGDPGEVRAVKAYAEGEVHYRGELVTHNGATYQAREDSAHAPPHDTWRCIAAAGKDAAQFTIRGTYSEAETYRRLDIVALNGSSFIARADPPGVCPGDGWQLIASAGRPGRPGPRGERGETGTIGQAGERAPTIIGWKLDVDRYRATPILSDGSEAPALQLRALFEQFQIEAR